MFLEPKTILLSVKNRIETMSLLKRLYEGELSLPEIKQMIEGPYPKELNLSHYKAERLKEMINELIVCENNEPAHIKFPTHDDWFPKPELTEEEKAEKEKLKIAQEWYEALPLDSKEKVDTLMRSQCMVAVG